MVALFVLVIHQQKLLRHSKVHKNTQPRCKNRVQHAATVRQLSCRSPNNALLLQVCSYWISNSIKLCFTSRYCNCWYQCRNSQKVYYIPSCLVFGKEVGKTRLRNWLDQNFMFLSFQAQQFSSQIFSKVTIRGQPFKSIRIYEHTANHNA